MTDKSKAPEEGADAEPHFDVRARRPEGLSLDDLAQRLTELARMSPEKAQALVKALRSGPVVVLGRNVNRARADRARELSRVGLLVEVTPVLELAPKVIAPSDGSTECPACGERAVLGPERQCPHCGVYVDKVTPEFLLRRKIQEQERARLAWQLKHQEDKDKVESAAALEARLRDEIRAELEARHGLISRGGWRGALGSWQGLSAVGAVASVAFVAGWWVPRWLPASVSAGMQTASAQPHAGGAAAPQDVDALLARLDEFAPAAGRAASAPTAMAAADSLRGAGVAPGARVLQGPDGPLFGALSRAAAGGEALSFAGNLPALDPATVPRDLQPRLIAQLALALAESGQSPRAAEVRDSLDSWRNVSDAEVAGLLRRTRLLVDAWALVDRHPAAASARLETLRSEAAAITLPAERVTTLSALATVLAHHPNVPESMLQALMSQAAESLKAVTDTADRAQRLNHWLLAEGQQQLVRARQEAAAGHVSRARTRTMSLANLSAQSQDPATTVVLMAQQAQAERLVSEAPSQGAAPWLAVWAKIGDPVVQGQVLRAVAAQQPGVVDEDLRKAAATLAARTDTASGLVRARALTQLALLWAEAGQAEPFAALRDRALQTPGVSGEALVRLRAELLAEADIGLAAAQQRGQQLAQADRRWRHIAGYLL